MSPAPAESLRQSQLRDARPHRDAARGPALPGELVPVRQRRRRPTRFPAAAARCCKATPTDPLMIEVNTSTEYWQKGASLIHTDPAGARTCRAAGRRPRLHDRRHAAWRRSRHRSDAPAPASTRATRIAPARRCARCSSRSRNGSATASRRPPAACRGSPTARWSPADSVGMPAVPGFAHAAGRQPHRRAGRLGRSAGRGSTILYGARVSAVDADGNEHRRHPPAADRGAARHLYRLEPLSAAGLQDELCDREGSFLPFAADAAARQAAGDPRPSLAERYPGQAAYVAAVRVAADVLARNACCCRRMPRPMSRRRASVD